jgi:hypothetical protein
VPVPEKLINRSSPKPQLEKHTRCDIRGVEVIATLVGEWAEALDIAPAVRILAVDWMGRVFLGLHKGPARGSGLVTNECHGAGGRSTRTAFGPWLPFQMGIVNTKAI